MATHAQRPTQDDDGEDRGWLKNVQGLPPGLESEDMHFDRLHMEPFEKPKADPSTPMGAAEAIGDFARGARDKFNGPDDYRYETRSPSPWRYLALIPVIIIVLSLVLGLVF